MNKLYLGNCLEIMDKHINDNYIDCTITSPPYNKGEKKNAGKLTKEVTYENYNDTMDEEEYQDNQIKVLNKIFDKTKTGGHCFYNHKIRFIDGKAIAPWNWITKTKWNIRQEIIWNRMITSNIRGWRFWQYDERIYWLYKPRNKGDIGDEIDSEFANKGSVWNIQPANKKKEVQFSEHACPFPEEIPYTIIKALFKDCNKLIFDPYIGTGTTAVVSKKLGHQYIGIDISKKYIEFAKKRINGTDILGNILDGLIN